MTVEIGGQRLRTFSIEDTLVMLCVHGAKHFWERLGWVLDIAKLSLGPGSGLGVGGADRRQKWNPRECFCWGFILRKICLAPAARSVAGGNFQDRRCKSWRKKFTAQYADISDPDAGVLPRAVFRIQLRDGIGQGLRHTMRLAMSPTESDRQTVRLPRWLSPL